MTLITHHPSTVTESFAHVMKSDRDALCDSLFRQPKLLQDDIDALVQDFSNSSALAMELLQSYTKPLILFWMEETQEHISVHWQQGKCQLWSNCSMSWNVISCPGHLNLRLFSQAFKPVGHDSSTKKLDWYQLNGITRWSQQWPDQSGRVHQWAAYTWHWCIHIIHMVETLEHVSIYRCLSLVSYQSNGGDIRTCLHIQVSLISPISVKWRRH